MSGFISTGIFPLDRSKYPVERPYYSTLPSHLPKDIDIFHVTNIFKKVEMLPLAGASGRLKTFYK